MLVYGKTTLIGGFVLQLFNFLITKLLHMPALQTYNMVVVMAFIQLEHCFTTFKMVPQQQASLFKLRKYAVNRG